MSVVIVSTHDACEKDLISPTWCPLKSELFIGKALGSALYTDPDTIPKNLNASLSQASLPQLPHPSRCPLTRKPLWPPTQDTLTHAEIVKLCTAVKAFCLIQLGLLSLPKIVLKVNRAQLSALASLEGHDIPLAMSLSLNRGCIIFPSYVSSFPEQSHSSSSTLSM